MLFESAKADFLGFPDAPFIIISHLDGLNSDLVIINTTKNINKILLDYLLLFESLVPQNTLKSIAKAPRRYGEVLHYRQRIRFNDSTKFWKNTVSWVYVRDTDKKPTNGS
jgi:hypothetical protein